MAWLRRAPRVRTGDVIALVERGVLVPAQFAPALQLAQRVPSGADGWLRALDRLLLALAAALFVAGVICVVAYNWQAIGRWGKFALAQALVAALVLAALWRGLGTVTGKTLLTLAAAAIGPLLALFGQTYQTGADTFELFRGWALLALPLVLATCFAPAWLMWLAIVQVGALAWLMAYDLWWMLWFGVFPNWLLGAVFELVVLVAWEAAAHRFAWLSGRLGPRTIALLLVGLLTAATGAAIFDFGGPSMIAGAALWVLTMVGGWYAYRVRDVEIGMLALGWMSMTVVAMMLLARLVILLDLAAIGLWLGAGLLVAASAWGRNWLKAAALHADRIDEGAAAPSSAAATVAPSGDRGR